MTTPKKIRAAEERVLRAADRLRGYWSPHAGLFLRPGSYQARLYEAADALRRLRHRAKKEAKP